MGNFKSKWLEAFRNTASITNSNPLAFNGHHMLFKVRPYMGMNDECPRGTLGEQLSYWNGQKRGIGRLHFNLFTRRFKNPDFPWGRLVLNESL